MAALLILRDKVLKPVLAGAGKPRRGPKPKYQSQVDLHYANMQTELCNLFQMIGIAVYSYPQSFVVMGALSA